MKFGVLASGNFFRVLHVQPVLGRGFRPDEDQVPGRDAVVVLGYDLWKTEFASQPMASRSGERYSAMPSSRLSRSPANTFSAMGFNC